MFQNLDIHISRIHNEEMVIDMNYLHLETHLARVLFRTYLARMRSWCIYSIINHGNIFYKTNISKSAPFAYTCTHIYV